MVHADNLYFLKGESELTGKIRNFDWSSTPLGPLESWPVALKTVVGLMLNSKFPKALAWGPGLTTLYNDAFKPILGDKAEALGRSFQDVWAETWGELGPIVSKAFAGEATFVEDFPLLVERFGYPEQCYFTFCYSPVYDENGQIAGIVDTVIETTEKVQAERLSAIQNAELAHRIKNTLTMVSAIANHTLKSASPNEDTAKVLLHRFHALAETHNLLTSDYQSDALISDIVWTALQPHITRRENFSVSGPPVKLPEQQALSLALAVNELMTNAIKHGALSVDEGRVQINWGVQKVDNTRLLRFTWIEQFGPTVHHPQKRNFGSRLIEQVVPTDFKGQARLAFDPDGFKYELTADLNRFQRD